MDKPNVALRLLTLCPLPLKRVHAAEGAKLLSSGVFEKCKQGFCVAIMVLRTALCLYQGHA